MNTAPLSIAALLLACTLTPLAQAQSPARPDMPTGAPASSMPPARTATATMAPLPLPAASQKR